MATVPGLLVMTDQRVGNTGLTLSVTVGELAMSEQRQGTVLLTEVGG